MKATILKALEDMVLSMAGKESWLQILEQSGLNKSQLFLPIADIDDEIAHKLFVTTSKVMNITWEQACDAYGDYWVNVYAKPLYSQYYDVKTAREFLLNMTELHDHITRSIKNSRPPHFTYDWEDENTLLMGYQSHRGLIDLMIGLIRGVGKCFNEKLTVTKLSSDLARVQFQS